MNKDDVGELTPLEKELIVFFRQLNPFGQGMVRKVAETATWADTCRAKCASLEQWKRDHPTPRSTRRTHNPEGGIAP